MRVRGEKYGARVFVTLINWQYKNIQTLIFLGSQSRNKVLSFLLLLNVMMMPIFHA